MVDQYHDLRLLSPKDSPRIETSASSFGDFLRRAAGFDHSAKDVRWTSASLGLERIAIASDDPTVFTLFAAGIGGSTSTRSEADAEATAIGYVLSACGVDGFASVTVHRRGVALSARDLLIGLDHPDCPYAEMGEMAGWTVLSLKNDDQPSLAFRGHVLLVAKRDGWQDTAVSVLARGLFGKYTDAILFHAASVVIGGRGVMIAGASHSGKSTTSLTLASRGHQFFGDDTAWYRPSTRELLDFRRPVGVREGPRAAAIDAAAGAVAATAVKWEDSLRIPIGQLVHQEDERSAAPVAALFFLCGFERAPRAVPIRPSRAEIARLEPMPFSILNVGAARRMFELARLFSSISVYDLYLGKPEDSAILIEELMGHVHDSQ